MGTCDRDECTRRVHAQGLCSAHYNEGRRKGLVGKRFESDPQARFWSQVDKSSDCWLWTGYITRSGYGLFTADWHRWPVHRYAYETLVGPIPAGLNLDHLCRVRACVRPDHLEPVTQRQNVMRSPTIVAFNAAKTHCPQGHEYTAENTRRWRNRRICRLCASAAAARYEVKRRATGSRRRKQSQTTP